MVYYIDYLDFEELEIELIVDYKYTPAKLLGPWEDCIEAENEYRCEVGEIYGMNRLSYKQLYQLKDSLQRFIDSNHTYEYNQCPHDEIIEAYLEYMGEY